MGESKQRLCSGSERCASQRLGLPDEHPPAAPASGDSHTPRCSICKSPHLAEIERRYLAGEPTRRLGREFGSTSERSMRRHFKYFALDLLRLLQDCEDRGVDFRARVTPDIGLRALACLERLDRRDGLDCGWTTR